ncbi:MAG: hypothetical protein Q8K77_06730 [Thermodesulfovibrionales bacterium]|nr:hypothetical protein [Thermodesulfovibrionales bacterium]
MDDEEIHARCSEVKRLRKTLSELAPPLEALLKRRGFRIYKKEPSAGLVLPAKRFLNDFYEMLKKYSFRLFIRDVIKRQEYFMKEQVTKYAASGVTDAYVDFLLSVKVVEPAGDGFRLIKKQIKSFGETLEWFLCEILRREFSAEAAWGVKFKRPGVGGDYDVIAKIDGAILYMEVKSSPPKQIYNSEIAAFLDRTFDLSPEIAVFFMDTELRMKDKIVPMFEEELGKRFASPPPVARIEKELFQIWNKTFIINSKDSIAGNIERVLNFYFRAGRKNNG